MSLLLAILLAMAMILLLFAVASLVERGGGQRWRPGLRRAAYTLGLAVYCTSWTFYGSVGSAVRDGWVYLPIYLGPMLLLLLAPRFLARLSRAVAEEQAATVSDFIAARFGHDGVIARLVTVIALMGTVPYVALQLRSIGTALSIASGRQVEGVAMVVTAAALALFAMLFGARRYELSGRSEGLVYAIGLESLIKFLMLATVATIAVIAMRAAPAPALSAGIARLSAGFAPARLNGEVAAIMVISTGAIIVLPRQFYMGLVEAQSADDLPRARLGLAFYVAAMAMMILPIALAGILLLGTGTPADRYVLALPGAAGHGWALGLALVGGISAASSMAIVDSTALATMVSNDLIFPTIIRGAGNERAGAIGRRMLITRRVSIAGIMALALAWALLVPASRPLAAIGLIAFAAMAQFTPHLVLATFGGGRDPLAGRASLAVGLALWTWTLALPQVMPAAWLAALARGPLDPLHLFGIGLGMPITHGVVWSLGGNLAMLGLVMARHVSPPALPRLTLSRAGGVANLGELARLVAGFIGEERTAREFPEGSHAQAIDRKAAARAQELIASVVGASSARALVASALAGGRMDLAEVTRLLDEGGQALRFSRQLLAATFENIEAGISVVDAELNLVAWNSRYLDLFDYPPGMVRVGVPVADLIRHNARRGDFGPVSGEDDIAGHVEKRLGHLRRGLEHSFERRRPDGHVIKTVGGSMPGGGYVMSFTDITGEAVAREELRRTLDELENRVAVRTAELSEANRQLAEATRDKTRFLAAASHDLLQPLHAARLFTAAMERSLAREGGAVSPAMVRSVERAIGAAEGLLKALLDISKLDAGGVQPVIEPVALAPLLTDIADGIRPLAEERGLALRLGPLVGTVDSDTGLLRSILQNFLTNALRYTEAGGVLMGVRRRGDCLRIDVIDTGIGIAPDERQAIFVEFTRLGAIDAEGLGLGLAIASRIANLLGARIEVASREGRGSRFSLLLPAARPVRGRARSRSRREADESRPLCVLVVDNDPEILAASLALLEVMGHTALVAASPTDALSLVARADAALVDYHLDAGANGLDLIPELRGRRPGIVAALVTAERDTRILAQARRMKVPIIAKPAALEAISGFLAGIARSVS